MAKKHGARQQKKVAKQKAKRAQKRSELMKKTSTDPMIRLRGAGDWPVVRSLVSTALWEDGIGYLVLARQEPKGELIYATYLVDTYCLGVKNTFWHAGPPGDFKEMIKRMEETQTLTPVSPECLVKILEGSVEYAGSFGFRPHPEFRHTGLLLAGIDGSVCTEEYSYGRDGKPFYVRGPNETTTQAMVILARIKEAGGEGLIPLSGSDTELYSELEFDDEDEDDFDDDDDDDDNPLGLPGR